MHQSETQRCKSFTNKNMADIIVISKMELTSALRDVVTEVITNVLHHTKEESITRTPRKYTRAQIADALCVSLPTIHGMMKQGILPYEKVGRRTLFDADKVDTLVASGQLKKYRRV